jgi:hypothetical protein
MPQDLWKRIDKIFNQGTTYREVILKEGNSPIVICNCDDDDVDTLDAVFTGEEDVNDLIFPSPFVYSTDTILGYGHIDMITETFATGLITGNTINIETEKRVVKVTTFKCFSYNDPKPRGENRQLSMCALFIAL